MFEESPFSGICGNATLEVLIMLAGTFLLGLLLGYLLWGWLRSKLRDREEKIEELQKLLAEARASIAGLEKDLESREAVIADQEKRIQAQAAQINRQLLEIRQLEKDVKFGRSQRQAASVRASAAQLLQLTLRNDGGGAPGVMRTAVTTTAPIPERIIDEPAVPPKPRYSEKSLKKASKIFKRDIAADDLTLIEGIGPAISELLTQSGIATWVKLSQTSPMVLRVILDEGGAQFRLHKPKTWPRQAQMAVAGEWKKLRAYQDVLKGGK